MAKFRLCGGSYQSLSPVADAERTKNLIPENIEAEGGKSRMTLYKRPGLRLFKDFGAGPVNGMVYQNGHVGVAVGGRFHDMISDGSSSDIGSIGPSSDQVATIGSTNTEAAICIGGKVYIWSQDSFSKAPIDEVVAMVGATDGYFIALLQDTNEFRISGLFNGGEWDVLDIAQVSIFPGNLKALLIDHREIMLWGDKNSCPYYDSGNPDFPFDPVLNGFIEAGIAAAFSPARLDNTLFWLGADDRGGGVAWRAQGYLPSRVSNHAVENAWQKYESITDAIGYSLQINGHALYVLYFPSVATDAITGKKYSATWVYDVTTGLWHEWNYTDPQTGREEAFLGRCHVYATAWGKHLIGDRKSGKIYELTLDALDDNGDYIACERISPVINVEKNRVQHSLLELDAESGLATVQDPDGSYRSPQVMMQFSDNYGKTWSQERWRDLGMLGDYNKRQRWLQLGMSRGRIYKFRVTDSVPVRIIDGYVQVENG